MQATGISDLFGVKGRVHMDAVLDRLPCDTAAMIRMQLTSLDQLEVQIEEIEERIAVTLKPSPEVKLLRTVPGIGEILGPLVWLEIGEVDRFPRAENLASYAGLVPRIIASGGRIRHGPQRGEARGRLSNQPLSTTASQNRAAKRKTTVKTSPLTRCAFIHDVSP